MTSLIDPFRFTRRQALGLGAAALVAPSATLAQLRPTLAHGYDHGSAADRAASFFVERVLRTTGQSIQVAGNGRLGSSTGTFIELQRGDLPFWLGSSGARRAIAELQIFDAPFLIRDPDHLERIMANMESSPVAEFFGRMGLTLIAPIATSAHVITSTSRPIEQPGQLQGMKINVRGGAITASAFSELGASPISLPTSEVFAASSAGFIDAVAGPIDEIEPRGLHKAHRFVTLTRHVYGLGFLLAGPDFDRDFDIPMLDELRHDMIAFSFETAMAQDLLALEALSERGMEIVEIDPLEFEFVKKLTYDIYLSEAKGAYDMLNFIEDLAFSRR